MTYVDSKTYTFTFGESQCRVRLRNFRPEVVRNFNAALAGELLKSYQKEVTGTCTMPRRPCA
jgi:hypothetical protein